MSTQITDAERQLLLSLAYRALMEMKGVEGVDAKAEELVALLNKISGVDKRITVEEVR